MSSDCSLEANTSRESINELFLDRYRVTKILGEGSYGRVKLACDTQQNNRKVALKIINKSTIKKPEHVTRIKREVRILRLLNHPNIVKLYDVAETDKEIILSMEYIEGGELFDFIVANPRLNEKIARRIFRQIVSAVDYCHQSSVIHRDLKPENLLMDNDKNIKIIDFGFVNIFDPDNVLKTFCGSPFYASPEMILGKRYVGPEIDVWSMGVILFALLAGKLPFRDANVKELYKKITTSSFDMPNCIGKDSAGLIKHMLRPNPKDRATLEDVKNHEWINTGYDGPPESFVPDRPAAFEPLDKCTLSTMKLYGFEDDSVRKSITSSTTHPAFLLYRLILEHNAAEAKLAAAPPVSRTLRSQEGITPRPISLEVPNQVNSSRRRKSISGIVSVSSNTGNHYKLSPDAKSDFGSLDSGKPGSNLNPMHSVDNLKRRDTRKTVNSGTLPNSPLSAALSVIPHSPIQPSEPPSCEASNHLIQVTQTLASSKLETAASSKQRPRSFSFRRPSVSRQPASPEDTMTPTLPTTSRKASIADTISTFLDRSPHGTIKHADAGQPKLSISAKIGSALNKMMHGGKGSRRGSLSPEVQVMPVPRVTKHIYGIQTTSGKRVGDIVNELTRVLEINNISPSWNGFKVSCVSPDGIAFDIEICSIHKTQMHGLELRRKKGSVATYQNVCGSIISQLKL